MEKKEFIYTGNSMRGVFAHGDVIIGESVEFDNIEPGDIVIFSEPGNVNKKIVHRVSEKKAEKIQTHGDNNLQKDRYNLSASTEVFKVLSARRGAVAVSFSSGVAGLSEFRSHQLKVKFHFFTRKILFFPVRFAPFRLFAPNRERLEVRTFHRDRKLIKAILYLGNKSVANFDFRNRKWVVCGRWKLFFTPGMLCEFQVDSRANKKDDSDN